MYRIINNICPDYLKNYVSYTSDISCRHTRSPNCSQLYTPNCELFRKSFMYSGAVSLSPYIPYQGNVLLLLNHVVIVVKLCCVEGLMEDRCTSDKHSR